MIRLLFVVLVSVPIAEIAAFLIVGAHIGILATLALCFLTAFAGVLLIRRQGLGLIEQIRAKMEVNRMPARELGHGFLVLLSGAFLMTPGFITDTLGFFLLIPVTREQVWRFLVDLFFQDFVNVKTPEDKPDASDGGNKTLDLNSNEWRVQKAKRQG